MSNETQQLLFFAYFRLHYLICVLSLSISLPSYTKTHLLIREEIGFQVACELHTSVSSQQVKEWKMKNQPLILFPIGKWKYAGNHCFKWDGLLDTGRTTHCENLCQGRKIRHVSGELQKAQRRCLCRWQSRGPSDRPKKKKKEKHALGKGRWKVAVLKYSKCFLFFLFFFF